ncbi:hypothetical protein [Pseudoxanthomonas mexicana]
MQGAQTGLPAVRDPRPLPVQGQDRRLTRQHRLPPARPRCEGRPQVVAGRLILHGRYVCKARKPDCPQCVIRDLCRFKDKTLPG